MGNTPYYIIDKGITDRWKVVFQAESLHVEKIGSPRTGMEGVEQDWRCFDESGDLFRFTVCEVSEHNGLRMEAGSLMLVVGPSARKDASAVFSRFERILAALGARQRDK